MSTTERHPPEEGARAGADFVAAERVQRLGKLETLRERGVEPYPVRYDRDTALADVRERFGHLTAGAETGEVVRVAGRVMLIRRHGGLVFADLGDQTGTLQLMAARDQLGDEEAHAFAGLDRGDWIGVEGTVIVTRRGELSIRVRSFALLSKALRALPDKHHGLVDADTRLRQRYLDLMVNPETRRVFAIRSRAIAAVRRVLVERGFTEVETPVLDAQAGGATARPFATHHHALDLDMYLRIALELPLKRCVVGGLEKVFEIGRVFRNEGLDTRHNPEFTLLEAYEAFADYHDVMGLVETLVSEAARDAIGTTRVAVGDREVDLAPPWRRVTMAQLIEEVAGVRMHPSMPIGEARAICDRLGIAYESGWGSGRLMSEVHDAACEPTLVEPTFVCDYPREVSPLARAHRDDPDMVERFEAVVGGRELANAYSELNDPVDQRARFEADAAARAAGGEEAERVDEDYIRALEYGLPPTGGLGIGLDRVVMLLAGTQSIRDVILFPTLRPEDGVAGRATHEGLSSSGVPTAESLAAKGRAAPSSQGPPQTTEPALPPAPAAQAARPALPQAPAAPPLDHPATELPRDVVARVLAWLTALGGLVFLLPLLPFFDDRFGVLGSNLLGRPERVASHVLTVVGGLALLLLAPELRHHKRRAWQAALAVFAAAAVIHLLKGPHPAVTLYSAAMVVALAWFRDAFPARSDPGSLLSVIRFVPAYLAAVTAFGVGSLLIERHKVTPGLDPVGVVQTVFGGLVGLGGPYRYHGRFFEDFFPAALLTLGVVGLAILAALVFKAVAQRGAGSGADRARARELVHRHGSDTLAYFALRDDKSYFFSSDCEAMIAYTFVSGYALASGDPIGAPASIPRVIEEFLDFCRARAWHVAFLAVREADLPLYRQHGLNAVYLGDEAIVRCQRFSLQGSHMKPVRAAVNRVDRHHTFKLMRESDASPRLVAELNAIRERWRGKAPERGFTMELGGEVRGVERDFLLAIAFDAEHRPVGFLRLVPCYGDDPGWSLDLMQRNPDSANGLTEYLTANAALALGERGFDRFSLNFAAWGRLFDSEARRGLAQRALAVFARALNPFFQIKSLRDFNAKFDPEWLPRSIVVEDSSAMPKVGVLYASVEGFLNLPVIGRYLVPPVAAERR